MELRIDVDGPCPTKRVSADYFRLVGDSPEYQSSMRIDAPRVRFEATRVTITGTAAFSKPTRHRQIRVTIPRVSSGAAPASATLRHLSPVGTAGETYACRFESDAFRRVELEEAVQQGVEPVRSYDTGSLPSGGLRRTLSGAIAFREAGIEVVSTGEPRIVDTSSAGPDATWSDAELHAAMEVSFSRWRDSPQWAVWLLHAVDHDDPYLGGIMFDRDNLPRQGCAVFYGPLRRSEAEALRHRLHSCVHELGHGFNLLHSWEKSLAAPPVPSRPDAISWMNYPHRFSRGAAAYWSAFGFAFDEPELVHLRHGFRDAVIMGGAPFGGDAALRRQDSWDSDRQDPGLRLRLTASRSFVFGVPVTVGAQLVATSAGGRTVPPVIGPQVGALDILIRAPNGDESVFVPLLRHCRHEEPMRLRPGRPPLRSQPFIHYGRNGYAFPTPGQYTVRGRFAALDGRIALSDWVPIHVLPAVSREDREIERLISENEGDVGKLITLMGSDARKLRKGDDTLREIIERYPHHPAAAVARVVRGTNLARTFKRVTAKGQVPPRPARPQEAAALIGAVIDLPAVERTALRMPREVGERRAVAAAVARVRAKPGIPPSVGGFITSRRHELAAVREAVGVAAGVRDQPVRA